MQRQFGAFLAGYVTLRQVVTGPVADSRTARMAPRAFSMSVGVIHCS
jgi:hypothetical protein